MMSDRVAKLTIVGALAVASAVIGTNLVSGAGESDESIFVSITPCRLVDTRPDTPANPAINVGPRDTKVGEDEAATFTAWGTGDADSDCDIPNSATAIATNTVAIAPSARSFMTLYPADVDNPGTANLNYVAGQAPTPNSANVPLSAIGTFNVYNAFGDVHVVIDINGYYRPATSDAPVGDQGPTGADGDSGTDGADGADGQPLTPGDLNRMSIDDIVEERWNRDPGREASIGLVQSVNHFAFDGTLLYAATRNGIAIVDPATNEIVDRLLEGSGPSLRNVYGVAIVDRNMYAPISAENTVEVIDLDTRTVTDSVPLAQPGEVHVIDGLVYVSINFSDETAVIDPSTNTVIDTFNPELGVAGGYATANGLIFEAVTNGRVAVIDPADPTNHVIVDTDPSFPAFIDPIPLPDGANDIVAAGEHLWVSGGGDNSVHLINPSTFAVDATISVGVFATAITFDGRFVYVGSGIDPDVIIVDATTRSVVGTIRIAEDSGSNAIGSIHFDGTNVWVGESNGDEVHRLLPR